jgi:glycosyltransferase involved in cell wall biosynthesis
MTTCAYVYRGSPIGSTKIHINSLISALENNGCFVHQYIPYDVDELGRNMGNVLLNLLPRTPLLLRNTAQYIASISFRKGLGQVVRDIRPDFIYERYSLFSDAGIRASDDVGCAHLLEINSILHRFPTEFVSPLMMPFVKKSELDIFQGSDHLFTVSGRLQDELRSLGVGEERISITLNGVDEEVFRPQPEQSISSRHDLGFIEDECVVVVSMGFDHKQMVDSITRMMITSLKELMEHDPTISVLVIGGGVQLNRAKTRIHSELPADRVIFTGVVPHAEVPKFLSAGDIAFIPWHNEFSSPLKLIEFLAMGLPVIAPALSGIMEIVDESFAWTFEHKSPHRAAEALLQATRSLDRRKGMGERARARVSGQLTWDSNARKVLAIAKDL